MTKLTTKIEIYLDETVKNNKFFQTVTSIEINKIELFKYAIMMWEVPPHIIESDFDYLQNKVPALESLLSDFIDFSENTIYNLSNDDRVKKTVSEAVGVGLGLKYSTLLLDTNPNKFKKIGVPDKGKYLDYSTIKEAKEYEIETKGTVSNYYNSMKKDIVGKKSNTTLKHVHLRYGTISMIKNKDDKRISQCVIVDDPPENINIEYDDTFNTQLWNYGTFLSYIIDSKYYNKYIKPLVKNRTHKVKINNQKFYAKYNFKGNIYFGECFDYRLIRDLFKDLLTEENSKKDFFKLITKKIGKTKFFIGLDSSIIAAINEKNIDLLNTFEIKPEFEETQEGTRFLDKDGILIIKSKNGTDKQLEEIFPEAEVKNRLGSYGNYIQGNAHKCNAPCRSKEKEGKPCDKLTYRNNCHFHR